MQIKLEADDVILAVKEYMARRGLPDDLTTNVFVRGGRKGNSGTAEVEITLEIDESVSIDAPQIYENIVANNEAVDAEAILQSIEEDNPQMELELVYSENGPKESVPVDEAVVIEEEIVTQEAQTTTEEAPKTLGSLFGEDPVEVKTSAPEAKPTNPFDV